MLILISLSACDSDEPALTPTIIQPAVATTVVLPATDTPQPTLTAPPPLVVLLAPPGAEAMQVSILQPLLAELAAQDGFDFEVHSELPPLDEVESLQFVVALSPDPGLGEMASAYPNVRFLGVGIPTLQAGGNLSLVGVQGERPDEKGFLAGYLAAVITPNWRVGVLSLSDNDASQVAQQGFINGAIFYCGLCRPAYPPFFQYPIYAGFPSGASLETQQAAVDTLVANAVETVYVAPGAAGDELLAYLAQSGLKIIAGIEPLSGLEDRWVVSIKLDWDDAVRQIWPVLTSTEPGISLEPPLLLSSSNESLLSPGRQGFVERMMADLDAGYIDTGVNR
jgi:hypothetical protein